MIQKVLFLLDKIFFDTKIFVSKEFKKNMMIQKIFVSKRFSLKDTDTNFLKNFEIFLSDTKLEKIC